MSSFGSLYIFYLFGSYQDRSVRMMSAKYAFGGAQSARGRTLQNNLAGEEGFEPSHAGIKIQCLNQLGDSPTHSFNNLVLLKLLISCNSQRPTF